MAVSQGTRRQLMLKNEEQWGVVWKLPTLPTYWNFIWYQCNEVICCQMATPKFVWLLLWLDFYLLKWAHGGSLHPLYLAKHFSVQLLFRVLLSPKTWHCQHFSLFSVCLIKLVTFLTEIYLHHFKFGSLPFYRHLAVGNHCLERHNYIFV